ncbi:MAG: acetate--CoA ligase family protein [Chloroflexota bacterium]
MAKDMTEHAAPHRALDDKLRTFLDGKERVAIPEHEAKAFLGEIGLPVPRGVLIPSDEAATGTIPEGLHFPVVAKVASSKIVSKSEVKGVRTGIMNREGLRGAVTEISRIKDAEGVLVEEQAPAGVEVIIGGIRDAQFGPVVMFGLGGVFVELFRDVAFALAPLSRDEAQWLVAQVRGYPLLKGFRGRPPIDLEALLGVIVTVSHLIASGPLEELDLNPVALYPEGCMVLDAKMLVR